VVALSVQFDGERVVSGAYDYLVKVWDPMEGTCIHTLEGHANRVYSLQVCMYVCLYCMYTYGWVGTFCVIHGKTWRTLQIDGNPGLYIAKCLTYMN